MAIISASRSKIFGNVKSNNLNFYTNNFANFTNTQTGTYVENNKRYKYVTFTGSSTLTIDKPGYLEVLVVGGGGGGRAAGSNTTGGGGGGVRYGAFYVNSGNYSVSIGGGGSGGTGSGEGGNGGHTFLSGILISGGGGGSMAYQGGNPWFNISHNGYGGGGGSGPATWSFTTSGGNGGGSPETLSYVGSAVTYGSGGISSSNPVANRGEGGRRDTGGSGTSGVVVVRTIIP
jgi:hypothetical protein